MSGFFSPAAAKMSMTSIGGDGPGHELSDRQVEVLVVRPVVVVFAKAALTAWKKPTSSLIASACSWGTARAKALESSVTACRKRLLPFSGSCAEDVLHRTRYGPQTFGGAAVEVRRVVEAVEHGRDDLVLLQHDGDGLLLRDTGLVTVPLGVAGEGLLELLGDARGSPRPGRPACPCRRGSRGRWPASGRGRASACPRTWCAGRGVEAGEPHVADDDHLERVFRVLEALGERLSRALLRMCCCHSGGSEAEPVITTLMAPLSSSSSCHSGRSLMIAL